MLQHIKRATRRVATEKATVTNRKYVTYLRVSTAKQGQSGLGLEAQQAAVDAYLNGGAGEVVGRFVEVETGKGANALDKRPELRAALALCKKTFATLLIAKLDRLARNVHFISGLIETGVDFIAADMPQANKVMIQMHSVMSEWERDEISRRTTAALAAAKARGVNLGVAGPANLRPNIEARQKAADQFAAKLSATLGGFIAQGMTQIAMVEELNAIGIRTPTGKTWSRTQLQRTLARLV